MIEGGIVARFATTVVELVMSNMIAETKERIKTPLSLVIGTGLVETVEERMIMTSEKLLKI